ncbi:MAG: pantoate--beta-alanine ligase [Ferruginibacter sp.]|nr:pantoate--beta-alanine ligase [Bacteroidota bacterium]MBX2918546.1 pantoate--beta-alanine ligase [Ferruginibacter sp.]MCB0707811.1 pantoate--beta-alanine ligase [Chitinophagaceae bacterium]
MRIFKKTFDIKEYLLKNKKIGVSIGFVPTMGALHQGHISLLEAAKKNCSLVVSSIFVNPTQFNDKADFDNYPVTIESDIDKLERAGCDVLFLPTVTEMYPHGETLNGKYNLGYLETVLEGKYRPGHFQGVCQVVHRLLNIIPANNLYLGQKDYQQCMVIKKMLQLTKINTNVIICPTLREDDGLAMSSRNMRLNETERKKSVAIFEALSFIKKNIVPGDINSLKKQVFLSLVEKGFKPDYVEIASSNNLSIIDVWDGKIKLVALIAAFNGKIRLIDNLLLQ